MSACRNLLVISDDPYYNNFNNTADENRHAHNPLEEIDDHNISNKILNPESVASIRNLLNTLNHSFMKIEKYDKDLFSRDNFSVSSKLLKYVKNDDEVKKPPLPQSINVYSVPETTIINTMANSIIEDKIEKNIQNEETVLRKEKGKVKIEINEINEINEDRDENHPSQVLFSANESLMEKKFKSIPIQKIPSSFSSISISIDSMESNSSKTANNSYINLNNINNNNNNNNNNDINNIPSTFSSLDSFHTLFNSNSSLQEDDSFLNSNKLYNNIYLNSSNETLKSMNSKELITGTTELNNKKYPSKIQNFPPEILARIFRYVRIVPKEIKLKNQKQRNKHSKGKISAEASSSSSYTNTNYLSSPSYSASTSSKQKGEEKNEQDNNYNYSDYYGPSNFNSNTDPYNDYTCEDDNGEDDMNTGTDFEKNKSNSSKYSNSNAYNDVYSCVQVCRHWSHLAQKELYHTLSFYYNNIVNPYLLLKIAASLEAFVKNEKEFPTRNIVLRVSHDGKVPDSKEWYDRKSELAFTMILRNCPNLKYIALFGVNFSNLTAEVISSVCTNVHQLLFIPFSTSFINEKSLLHITEHCHSISSLILSFFKFSSKANIKKIFKNLESSLRNLDLIQVECEESDFDFIIPYLKNLEELGLMLTTSFTDSSLTLINRYCSHLEYINFTGLLNISDQGLENLFSIEKDSSFMNENLSSKMNDELLFHNYNYNDNTHNLSQFRGIGYGHNHVQHPKNKRIKRINLSDCMDITDEGLRIISNHCEALEAISFDDCPRITDDGFEDFIKHQSQLKYISISNSETLTNRSIECLNKYCPYIEKLNIKGCLKIWERTVKSFISYHPNLNTLCFHQEKNTFSRGFINYLNRNFSTEDFDDLFLKWNQ